MVKHSVKHSCLIFRIVIYVKLSDIGLLLVKIILLALDVEVEMIILLLFVLILEVIENRSEKYCSLLHRMRFVLFGILKNLSNERSAVHGAHGFITGHKRCAGNLKINDFVARLGAGSTVEIHTRLGSVVVSRHVKGDLAKQGIFYSAAIQLLGRFIGRELVEIQEHIGQSVLLFCRSRVTESDCVDLVIAVKSGIIPNVRLLQRYSVRIEIGRALVCKLCQQHVVGDMVVRKPSIITAVRSVKRQLVNSSNGGNVRSFLHVHDYVEFICILDPILLDDCCVIRISEYVRHGLEGRIGCRYNI